MLAWLRNDRPTHAPECSCMQVPISTTVSGLDAMKHFEAGTLSQLAYHTLMKFVT